MSYLRNPLQREAVCVLVCECVCVCQAVCVSVCMRERGGLRPKKQIGQDIISNQSEMEKCKSWRLQQYGSVMKSREIIDFRN